MTSIVWDGKELVADSRVTFNNTVVIAGGMKQELIVRDDIYEMSKIIIGGNFTYAGSPVIAIGVSGDYKVVRILAEEAKSNKYCGDFMNPKNYEGDSALAGLDLNILVVTDTFIGNIVAGYGDEMKNTEFPRNWTVVCGSYMEELAKFVNTPATARTLLSYAVIRDPATGGTLSVWNGNGLTHGIKPYGRAKLAWSFIKAFYTLQQHKSKMRKASKAA